MENDSNWSEHVSPDGRKFFYNQETGESQWEKPDILKSEEEKNCDWTEYLSNEGKTYYFNSKTKESVWGMPKEYSELLERKRKRNDNVPNLSTLNELFQSQKLNMPTTLAPSQASGNNIQNYLLPTNLNPIATNSANLNTAKPSYMSIISTSQEMDNKIRDIDEKKKINNSDLENLPKEDLHRLFKDMLRKAGVTSTWKWEDCERVLMPEELWKSIRSFSEKKSLFNEFVSECKKKEKEELKLKRDRLRTRFRQMLEEDLTLNSDFKFCEVINKYCGDERWRAVDERDRDELFQDYLDDLEKKECEDRKNLRESRVRNFKRILEEKRLPATTKWKEICLNFRDDSVFNTMEKVDRLRAFSEYILELDNKEKEESEETKKYQEYKNRENFREFLQQCVDKNEINAKTKWINFIQKLKDNPVYINLVTYILIKIGQEGSNPKDLFDDVMCILKEDYKRQKDTLKKYLKSNGIKFTSDTKFEMFDEKLRSFTEYNNMRFEIKRLLCNHFIKKARDKDKEQHKKEKKSIKKLESFLRKKKDLKSSSNYDNFKDEIENVPKFMRLTLEKRLEIFEKVIKCLDKEIRDTSSESGQIKKKKKKNKKKSKKKKSSSSEGSKLEKDKGDNLNNLYSNNNNLKTVNNYEEKEDGETSN